MGKGARRRLPTPLWGEFEPARWHADSRRTRRRPPPSPRRPSDGARPDGAAAGSGSSILRPCARASPDPDHRVRQPRAAVVGAPGARGGGGRAARARSISRRRTTMRCALPCATSSRRASTSSPTARCGGSHSSAGSTIAWPASGRCPCRGGSGRCNYDTHCPYEVVDRVAAPEGLGIVDEFRFARPHAERPMRVAVPGPMTLLMPMRRGGPYTSEETPGRRPRGPGEPGDPRPGRRRLRLRPGGRAQLRDGGGQASRGARAGRGRWSRPSTPPWRASRRSSPSTSASATPTTIRSRRPRRYRPLYPRILDARCGPVRLRVRQSRDERDRAVERVPVRQGSRGRA